jgi:hypothetical protein
MKKLMLAFVLCYPLLAFSQSLSKNDFVGTWNVVKLNICINDTSKYMVYLKDNSGKTDTVVEFTDQEVAERMYRVRDGFMKSIFKFKSDDSFSLESPEERLTLLNKYWRYNDQTKNLKICDSQEKESKIEVEFTIVNFEKGKIYLIAADGTAKIKIDLVKIN